MDFRQMLPLMLNGKLGEKEQALLKLTETRDPKALSSLITQMYSAKPKTDNYAILKRIIPSDVLGKIIKYFSG